MKFLQEIKYFLENPEENLEDFFENKFLIWIDHREFDNYIIEYVNYFLNEDNKIIYEIKKSEKERWVGIFLKNWEEFVEIPYKDDKMERDITINFINNFIKEKYKILWFKETLWDDTLWFIVLKNSDIEELKNEFWEDFFNFYFPEVEEEMFNLGMTKIWEILKERKKFKNNL